MTTYDVRGVLGLPRLQNVRMSQGEADIRITVALATLRCTEAGWREAGLRLVAGIAGVQPRTAQRARDRLVKAGLIECETGISRTHRTRWRFTTPLPDDRGLQDDTVQASDRGSQDVTRQGSDRGSQDVTRHAKGDINRATVEPSAEAATGDFVHDHRGSSRSATRAYELTTGVDLTEEPDRRAGARGGGGVVEGRVLPSGSAPRLPRNACEFCGSFEHITARCQVRDLAQEERDDRLKAAARNGEPALRPEADRESGVAEAGAALARKLMADRPTKPPEEVTRPRTDDERQAFARRQVSAARSGRVEPSVKPAADEAPLWQEEDPDEPPF